MNWRVVGIGVAVVLLAAAVAILVGEWRWRAGTRELRARLETARLAPEPRVFDPAQLDGAPEPVQRYLRAVLRPGQPIVTAASLRHSGTMDMGERDAQWKPFTSDQRVIPRRPGFDWDARVAMLPGLDARVHDAYVAGDGLLHATVLGLVTVMRVSGSDDVAQGELMRFLAEAVWYPTLLVPGQGVSWQSVDATTARATLADGRHSATLLFHFGAEGLVVNVSAAARGRTVAGKVVATPWLGRFWNYETHEGMRVPMDAEVSWWLPAGPRPYWRGRITRLRYEFAR